MPLRRISGSRRNHRNKLFDSVWDNQGGLLGGGDARSKSYTNGAVRIVQSCLLHGKVKDDGKIQLISVGDLGVQGLEQCYPIETA